MVDITAGSIGVTVITGVKNITDVTMIATTENTGDRNEARRDWRVLAVVSSPDRGPPGNYGNPRNPCGRGKTARLLRQ